MIVADRYLSFRYRGVQHLPILLRLPRFSASRHLPNLAFIFEGQLLGSNVNAECVGRLVRFGLRHRDGSLVLQVREDRLQLLVR